MLDGYRYRNGQYIKMYSKRYCVLELMFGIFFRRNIVRVYKLEMLLRRKLF